MTEVLFALAFTNVFNLLPVQTVGNFGTTEFPFVWLLNHFGTSIADCHCDWIQFAHSNPTLLSTLRRVRVLDETQGALI